MRAVFLNLNFYILLQDLTRVIYRQTSAGHKLPSHRFRSSITSISHSILLEMHISIKSCQVHDDTQVCR
jgi:hypothetical protein